MKAAILHERPLPLQLFSAIGVIIPVVVGLISIINWFLAPGVTQREQSRALVQQFRAEHVADWSRIDQIAATAFEPFKGSPAVSDQMIASWQAQLIASFEEQGREPFVRLVLFFEDALMCVSTERCHKGDTLAYFEVPICIFRNKTWPYFEHLNEHGVIFTTGIRSFVDSRDCREIEIQALAHDRVEASPA